MPALILATKLYIPSPRPGVVSRPRLSERLNEGLARGCKLTLISAAAGFGKTTLVSEWTAGCGRPVAWVSLDEGDSDPARFLAYLIAALQTIKAGIGEGLLPALQSPQPLHAEAVLTSLLNDIAVISDPFLLVLDDYHAIDSQPVDRSLVFLVEHQPSQMHLVIATREDPRLSLARLRARGQLNELRAADLRFTPAEAAEFLNRVMALNLSAAEIAALENRTEGWIAGLQLAAISMQGHSDTAGFIHSFTGSHRFVLDYLMEEVLTQQSEDIQAFLLRTSILGRLCGPLCEAVFPDSPGQETLEYLEHANLFVVPLDNARRWYRYHQLFADLLRQRLQQDSDVAVFHVRASQWYEDNGLGFEAFHHATAANDVERAERLITGGQIPLHSRAAVTTVLDWLDLLPKALLDARPWLWVMSALLELNAGQTTGVEEKLQAAEKAIQNTDPDGNTRDLMGQIAALRATLALARYQPEAIIIQARRALEYLHPENLPFCSRALRTLGFAYQLQGNRTDARQAYAKASSIRQAPGNIHLTVSAITGLGNIQEAENQLYQAAESYRSSLQLLSDQGPPNADQEYIGLARIYFEWNDLDASEHYAQQSLELARQYDRTVDRFVNCEVFLARLKLARGDISGAADILEKVEQSARQQNFVQRIHDIVTLQVRILLRQDNLAVAAQLARQYELPLTQARVLIAQDDPFTALAMLESYRQQMAAHGWVDEQLKAIVLQAVALYVCGDKKKALDLLGEALALAEPGGFIRLFVDEGEPMRLMISDFRLVLEKQLHGYDRKRLGYVDKLLAAFEPPPTTPPSRVGDPKLALLEPLSQRELEILKLIDRGLSNREIGERLFLALDTVKGHNRRIFDKLQVQRRTEAIARARELGLL